MENVDHFVDNLERIEAPSQLVAGLRDPLLQKYLMLGFSADLERRLEFWLLRNFEEEMETLREGFGMSMTLSDTLSAIVSYTESSKVGGLLLLGAFCSNDFVILRLYFPSYSNSLRLIYRCGTVLQILA